MYPTDDLTLELNVIPGSIGAALLDGEQRLHYADVIRPRRHAELLLESVLNIDRTELYLRSREQLGEIEQKKFRDLLVRREAGEPVQYIVGWAPFFGRRFQIFSGVFIPRFETETIIEQLVQLVTSQPDSNHQPVLLDLCCGCGVIGLTAALEVRHSRVVMIDSSEKAIENAVTNRREQNLADRVEIIKLDALDEFPRAWHGRFDFVLANPPYIPVAEMASLPKDVREGEPRAVLTDEGDGLSFYRRWCETVPQVLAPGGRLIVECGDNAAPAVVGMLAPAFDDVTAARDINGMERVVTGSRREQVGRDSVPVQVELTADFADLAD
jgi:release factor glutamine methyltransferase